MFKFRAEQKICEINGIKIGGQMGEYPTALFGSIFYKGDPLVIDEGEGMIHRSEGERVIRQAAELAEKAGVPLIIDMVASTPKAIVEYIDFVAEVTEAPFTLDGTTVEVRLAGARHVAERGLEQRAIYNSIGPGVKSQELEELGKLGLRSVIIQLINAKKPTVQGRLEILERLSKTAGQGGFDKLLVDTAVLDVVDPGLAGRAIFEIKDRFGYPCGCAPTHTHKERWKTRGNFDKIGRRSAEVSTATALQILGANFLFYPLNRMEIIPAMAMVDSIIAYCNSMTFGIKPKGDHPLYKLFKRP